MGIRAGVRRASMRRDPRVYLSVQAPVYLGAVSSNSSVLATGSVNPAEAVAVGDYILAATFNSLSTATFSSFSDNAAGSANDYSPVFGTDVSGVTNTGWRVKARICRVVTPILVTDLLTYTYNSAVGNKLAAWWKLKGLLIPPMDSVTNNITATGNPNFRSPPLNEVHSMALALEVTVGGMSEAKTQPAGWSSATQSGYNGGSASRFRLGWKETTEGDAGGVLYNPIHNGGANTKEIFTKLGILKAL